MNNPNLPTVGAEFEYTSEMVKDLKKCRKNILYFAEKFFYIISLDEGKKTIDLHYCQKRALRKMRDNRFFILLASRQIGKALALDTPIPTPNGWTTMGKLKDGDIVFDNKGQPTTVTKAWDVMVDRPCYKIIFDNGEEIVADEGHLWFTQDTKERRKGSVGSKKTTVDIYNDLYRNDKEPNHRIPISMTGVEYKERDLPIDPYILGLWLGDGCNDSSIITVGNRDASEMQEILKEQSQFDKIQLKTYQKGSNSLLVTVNEGIQTKSLNTLLKANKLLHNKHIPVEYMASSRDQRFELLRGLMDSDGYISKTGIAQFYNMNLELVKHVKNLIASLGYKVTYKENDIWYKGTHQGKCGVLTYTPREYVAKLAFKRNRIKCRSNVNDSRRRAHWHYIKDVLPVESEPVRCITVDSNDSMFLCGNQYIPTSNTTMMTIYALWVACFNDDQRILIVANKEGTALEIMSRIRMAYEELPNWLKPGVKEYGKTSVTLANGTRIGISTTTGTAARGQSVNCVDGNTVVTLRDKETQKVFDINMKDLASILEESNGEMPTVIDI